ncbi:hypothetical protein [Vulgatibacter sp.]|uniref:hypothetical protein n=1 Tax=Vulgatibacter sp. TaxID=1971226 RepID=UPI00356588FB
MNLLAHFIARLRRERGNQRIERQARRAILGSIALGDRRREPTRLWRALLWPLLALALYQVEAGMLAHFGPEVARVEVAVLFVTFFALQLGAIEGAVAAYLVGYVADLFVQGPPGLCRFVAVAVWTLVRVGSARVGMPGWLSILVWTLGAAAAWQAGVLGGLALVAGEGNGPGTIAWLSVVPQAILTALFALPLHAGLGRLDRFSTRGEPAR